MPEYLNDPKLVASHAEGTAAASCGAISPPLKWQDAELHPIPGCTGYAVSADGRVWSCLRFSGRPLLRRVPSDVWKCLRPSPRKEDGRKRFTIRRDDGTYRRCYGSHLVLEAFGTPRPTGLEACHCDGNCTNDAIINLRWDTSTANKADMLQHGTRSRGTSINTCKLSEEQVKTIRARRNGGERLRLLAVAYGVSETLVSLIARNKIWRHV